MSSTWLSSRVMSLRCFAGIAASFFAERNRIEPLGMMSPNPTRYTNWPLLDLMGLVDPTIANIDAGYARKTGPVQP